MSVKTPILVISLSFLILSAPFAAYAALGGDVNSVQSDQLSMQAKLRTTQTASYVVHEIQPASGILVREYVSPAGKVFAVAWQWPSRPDLRQVLGDYFEPFIQAAKTQRSQHPGRRPLLIQEPGLVVQMGGHMRAFTGKAYIPEMLPQGVRAEEIQ